MARQSTYTPEIAAQIVDRLSEGEPLAVICRDKGFPCDDTVRNWAAKDEDLARAIACARDAGHDVIAWRARMTLRGFGPERGGESTGDVQRDKAIADYDLRLLAKWNPKGYGDSSKVELSGQVTINDMTEDEMRAELAMLAGVLPAKTSEPEDDGQDLV